MNEKNSLWKIKQKNTFHPEKKKKKRKYNIKKKLNTKDFISCL